MNWRNALVMLDAKRIPHVLITVSRVDGSAPRNTGSKMVVTEETIFDSIGGGNLEYRAMQLARESLNQSAPVSPIQQHQVNLAQDVEQCCGGKVELLLELFAVPQPHVAIFGAGHVGEALLTILTGLPFAITVFDSRREFLENQLAVNANGFDPEIRSISERWGNSVARCKSALVCLDNPYHAVESCPPGSWFIVMTHSHDLDFELCEAILTRESREWCGLIASKSKAAQFRSRLKRKGFSVDELQRLEAPIGVPDLGAKEPMAVAVSISARLLNMISSHTQSGAGTA